MAQATPLATEFSEEHTTRASHRFSEPMPAAYDEKENFDTLKDKLRQRKKPIYAGLAFVCVVVIAVSVAVSTSSGTKASTSSGYTEPTETTPAPTPASGSSADNAAADTAAGVHGVDLSGSSAKSSTGGSSSRASSGSSSKSSDAVAGEANLEQGELQSSNNSSSSSLGGSSVPSPTPATSAPSTTNAPSAVPAASDTTTPAPTTATPTTTPTPTPTPTTATPPPTTATPAPTSTTSGSALPYKAVDFNWKDASLWEYADGSAVSSSMVNSDGIKLTPSNSAQPIRTKQGWSGEKIVYIEWERSDTSDTNIWMLNTKLQNQFATGNGWPYWGEIDIFEMFTQDAITQSSYDFSGFGPYTNVASYGQLTLHNGPATGSGDPCYCPASASKSVWYQNTAPMTSGCTAQFSNDASNSMATIWGTDSNGQYLQLYQKPTITAGGKVNGVQTYDVTPGGTVTPKIYNNKDLFWGTPSTAACASGGGHNPSTGFPFFEEFRLILEEQKKNDGSAWFKVNNIQIFTKA